MDNINVIHTSPDTRLKMVRQNVAPFKCSTIEVTKHMTMDVMQRMQRKKEKNMTFLSHEKTPIYI